MIIFVDVKTLNHKDVCISERSMSIYSYWYEIRAKKWVEHVEGVGKRKGKQKAKSGKELKHYQCVSVRVVNQNVVEKVTGWVKGWKGEGRRGFYLNYSSQPKY